MHEFSEEDDQRRIICVYCGVPVSSDPYTGQQSYVDYSVPIALYEKRTKW